MEEDFDIREEQARKGEKDFENALRPLRFGDFSGQQKVVENLEVFVEAAKYRGEPLDHTLLHGPPGLGKTTLSNIIANELGVGFKITSRATLPAYSHRSSRATCSSSTRYIVCRPSSRSISTRQWKTIAST